MATTRRLFLLSLTLLLALTSADCDVETQQRPNCPAKSFTYAVKKTFEIQGAGLASDLVNQTVTTGGTVTAVNSVGFYIQDPHGDGDSATSDAIFVFAPDYDIPQLKVGDNVAVSGVVQEYSPGGDDSGEQTATQVVAAPEHVTILSSGNGLPEPVTIGGDGFHPPNELMQNGIAFWERFEGMRVKLIDPLLVAPTYKGTYYVVVDGGASAKTLSDRSTLVLTKTDYNPEVIDVYIDSDRLQYDSKDLRPGAKLSDLVGVVSYRYGRYAVLPTEKFLSVDGTIERQTTSLRGDSEGLIIAGFNVENFAKDERDMEERLGEIAKIISESLQSPDIVALVEIIDDSGLEENDGITSAAKTLQAIVDAIVDAGGPKYEGVDNPYVGEGTNGGIPGGNIRVAFLYNKARVGLSGIAPVTDKDEQQDGRGPFARTRPPLAGVFSFNNKEVEVVVVHLSSKGGSAPLSGLEQPVEDRQDEPSINGSVDKRNDQAEQVQAYLSESQYVNKVVIGDFNEFMFNPPLEKFTEMYNLANGLPENERYSYMFSGNAQQIDHILVSPNLKQNAKVEIVHVSTEFPEQVSDHDPIIAKIYPTST